MEEILHRLGEDETTISATIASEHRDLALSMTQQATRGILIFTRDLDPAVYDTPEFLEAASTLARRSPHSYVRILVQDSARASREGHRLVSLAQRLSSRVEIRKPPREYQEYNQAFFIADETGYIRRPLADRYEGVARFKDRLAARELALFFREVWERSHADRQLRRLHV